MLELIAAAVLFGLTVANVVSNLLTKSGVE